MRLPTEEHMVGDVIVLISAVAVGILHLTVHALVNVSPTVQFVYMHLVLVLLSSVVRGHNVASTIKTYDFVC